MPPIKRSYQYLVNHIFALILVPFVVDVVVEVIRLDPKENVNLWGSLHFDLVQIRILERSSLGEETCFPLSIHYIPPASTMETTRGEVELVIFSAMDSLFEKTGLKPKDIDILIVNGSLFSPNAIFVRHGDQQGRKEPCFFLTDCSAWVAPPSSYQTVILRGGAPSIILSISIKHTKAPTIRYTDVCSKRKTKKETSGYCEDLKSNITTTDPLV
ncbi:hypothetical protein F3Y22_tig00111427pilonHSYRG00228 [Hibiscus syriacus]|uniref:FAE domain-containing protein n=1 Tax=Hibiscus syriacus TaxID=106335 RepID=A0A6A2YIK3_HIBSY|nr:hypothetical protein F3Y22_tig00111427pilonHSYRG00228 [Hibiscus syriacus]